MTLVLFEGTRILDLRPGAWGVTFVDRSSTVVWEVRLMLTPCRDGNSQRARTLDRSSMDGY